MDFSWMPHVNGFWVFPLLCVLFMAVMMFVCGGLRFGCRHSARCCDGRKTPRQTLDWRYAKGEIGKDEYDSMLRDLNA